MNKLKALAVMLTLSSVLLFATPLMAVTPSYEDAPKTTGVLTISKPTIDILSGKVQVGPTGYYEYQDIGGTLNSNYYDDYGPKEPYSVSVRISSVTPSGYKVTVSIRVNGVEQWAGSLGAGDSSPTITCSGGTTYVRVINNNDVQVTYIGRISWYFN
jgi:hypothetical protein